MINTCCNLYFYYNFIVHGGIRHLENSHFTTSAIFDVHGGIRHLENKVKQAIRDHEVHGGIRHLENGHNLRG